MDLTFGAFVDVFAILSITPKAIITLTVIGSRFVFAARKSMALEQPLGTFIQIDTFLAVIEVAWVAETGITCISV